MYLSYEGTRLKLFLTSTVDVGERSASAAKIPLDKDLTARGELGLTAGLPLLGAKFS
jgi:hypothetical protein